MSFGKQNSAEEKQEMEKVLEENILYCKLENNIWGTTQNTVHDKQDKLYFHQMHCSLKNYGLKALLFSCERQMYIYTKHSNVTLETQAQIIKSHL